MATALPAPPERIWPWLVQMGGGRGGWYSRDWLDNNGEPSADRIVPEWQSLEVGRQLKARQTGGPWRLWSRTAPWCCSRATGCPPATVPIRGRVPCLLHTWTVSRASTCAPLHAAG